MTGEQSEIRFLGDVHRLVMEKDDIVVLKTPMQLTHEQCVFVRDFAKETLGEDRKLLILHGGIEIGILSPEAT